MELSAEISELQGTLSEQNARLEEYYDHMKEQDNNIESLKFDKKWYMYIMFKYSYFLIINILLFPNH